MSPKTISRTFASLSATVLLSSFLVIPEHADAYESEISRQSAVMAENAQISVETEQLNLEYQQIKKESEQFDAEYEQAKYEERLNSLLIDRARIEASLHHLHQDANLLPEKPKLEQWLSENTSEIAIVSDTISSFKDSAKRSYGEAQAFRERALSKYGEAQSKLEIVKVENAYLQEKARLDALNKQLIQSGSHPFELLMQKRNCEVSMKSLAGRASLLHNNAPSKSKSERLGHEQASRKWQHQVSVHEKAMEIIDNQIDLYNEFQRLLATLLATITAGVGSLTIYLIRNGKWEETSKLKQVLKGWIDWIAYQGLTEDIYRDLVEMLDRQLKNDDLSKLGAMLWLLTKLAPMMLASLSIRLDNWQNPHKLKGGGSHIGQHIEKSEEEHRKDNDHHDD
jgi:hypothetical protein